MFQNERLKNKVTFSASVMIWGTMSAKEAENLHFVESIMNTNNNINGLQNNLKFQIEKIGLNNMRFY